MPPLHRKKRWAKHLLHYFYTCAWTLCKSGPRDKGCVQRVTTNRRSLQPIEKAQLMSMISRTCHLPKPKNSGVSGVGFATIVGSKKLQEVTHLLELDIEEK
jgi:hypothetical protein